MLGGARGNSRPVLMEALFLIFAFALIIEAFVRVNTRDD